MLSKVMLYDDIRADNYTGSADEWNSALKGKGSVSSLTLSTARKEREQKTTSAKRPLGSIHFGDIFIIHNTIK